MQAVLTKRNVFCCITLTARNANIWAPSMDFVRGKISRVCFEHLNIGI